MIEQLKSQLEPMVAYCKAHKALCAMDLAIGALIGAMIAFLLPPPTAETMPVVAIVVAAILIYRRLHLQQKLEERQRAIGGGPLHRVFVNAIEVGEVRDAELARMEGEVRLDARTQFAQMRDAVRMLVVRPLLVMVNAGPIACFWVVVTVALLAPTELTQAWGALQSLPPEELAAASAHFVHVLLISSMLASCWRSLTGTGSEFFDHFDRRVRTLVRLHVGCIADGDLVVRLANHEAQEGAVIQAGEEGR